MKKKLVVVAVFICGVFSINAQNIDTVKNRISGSPEFFEQRKKLDPTLEARTEAHRAAAREWIKNNSERIKNSKAIITIPVVVHIVGNIASNSISDAQVIAQIAAMNIDYAGLNPHSMGAFASTLKVNTGIQFCLAKRDPNDKSTSGIERRTGANTPAKFGLTNADDNILKHYSTGGLDQWSPQKYMNIWICDLEEPYAGYGMYPESPLYDGFGATIDYALIDFFTHEVGHCLNLAHIWGDDNGACNGTDDCDDTPNQANSTFGAPTGVKTDACTKTSPGIMYMNFMDYTDASKLANFTPDQKVWMQEAFADATLLKPLITSNGCTPVGIEENDFIQNISIYPNPTNGELDIKFNIANPCNVNVSIHNILGEEIYSFNKNKTSVVNANVDISNNASGIYFVKIKTEKQILTQKISLLK